VALAIFGASAATSGDAFAGSMWGFHKTLMIVVFGAIIFLCLNRYGSRNN